MRNSLSFRFTRPLHNISGRLGRLRDKWIIIRQEQPFLQALGSITRLLLKRIPRDMVTQSARALLRGDLRAAMQQLRTLASEAKQDLSASAVAESRNPLLEYRDVARELISRGNPAPLETMTEKIIGTLDGCAAKVSVIIPCYNYGRYLGEAVASIRTQTYKNIEIIIVDDGSTDSFTIAELDRLALGGIKLVRQSNQGLSSARNSGAAVASGEFLVFLDADDRLHHDAVALLLLTLIRQSDRGYAYPYQRFFGDEEIVWAAQDFNSYDLLWANHPSVCSMIRREVFEASRGFRREMKYGMEDWEYWLALSGHDHIGVCLPVPVFEHRRHGITMTHTAREKKSLIFEQLLSLNEELYTPRAITERHRIWRPLLTVVIPFFNGHLTIEETLASLRAQTLKNFETILVNDGSDLPEALAMLEKLRKISWLRVIDCVHKGPAGARNTGAISARSELLFFLDCDDLLDPTALEKLCLTALLHFQMAFVYSGVEHFGEIEAICLDEFDPVRLKQENYLTVSCVIRREVYCKVGGMDESLNNEIHEDYDFWLRLISKDYTGMLVPEPLFKYRRRIGGYSGGLIRTRDEGEMTAQLRYRHPALYGGAEPDRSGWKLLTDGRAGGGDELLADVAASFAAANSGKIPYLGARPTNTPELFAPEHWDNGKINILYLIPFCVVGGAEQVDLDILSGLPREDFQVTVLATEKAEHSWIDRFKAVTQEVFLIPNLASQPEQQQALLRYFMVSRAADILFIRNSGLGYDWLPSAQAMTSHIRTADLLHLYAESGDWVAYSAPLHASLDQRFVSSQDLKSYATQKYYLDPQKFTVVYCGIDPGRAAELPSQRQARRLLCLGENSTVIGFMGRMTAQKNPQRWLCLAEQIAARYEDVEFLMVGDGELLETCRRLAAELGLQRRVHFLGYRPDVPACLAAMDLLLMTSSYEGTPITVMEAMMAGLPVVGTDVGAMRECVLPELGELLPLAAPDGAFVEAVSKILHDAGSNPDKVAKRRAFILERFSVGRMQNAYRQAFRSLSSGLDRDCRRRDYIKDLMKNPLFD